MRDFEAPFNNIVKIKSATELYAMGIVEGALILDDYHSGNSFRFYKLSFDNDVGKYRGTFYSGFHLHCKTARIPVECLEFNRNDYPEYFI